PAAGAAARRNPGSSDSGIWLDEPPLRGEPPPPPPRPPPGPALAPNPPLAAGADAARPIHPAARATASIEPPSATALPTLARCSAALGALNDAAAMSARRPSAGA